MIKVPHLTSNQGTRLMCRSLMALFRIALFRVALGTDVSQGSTLMKCEPLDRPNIQAVPSAGINGNSRILKWPLQRGETRSIPQECPVTVAASHQFSKLNPQIQTASESTSHVINVGWDWPSKSAGPVDPGPALSARAATSNWPQI